MKMRNRHHDAWIFTTLKTNTMKNRCKIMKNMFYNIISRHKSY
jgi:hypothetical protein